MLPQPKRPNRLKPSAKISGSGHITLGDEYSNGGSISTDYFEGGCAGLVEPVLAQFMLSLFEGSLINPRTKQTDSLPITTLSSLGRRGLVDRDFIGALPGVPLTRSHCKHPHRPIRHCGIMMRSRNGRLLFNLIVNCEYAPNRQKELRVSGDRMFPDCT